MSDANCTTCQYWEEDIRRAVDGDENRYGRCRRHTLLDAAINISRGLGQRAIPGVASIRTPHHKRPFIAALPGNVQSISDHRAR
jgi:hypothetical protein